MAPRKIFVDAQMEAEVRSSLIAAGRSIGLVVDDEALVAPQFARSRLREIPVDPLTPTAPELTPTITSADCDIAGTNANFNGLD